MREGEIYKLTNKTNAKSYIGQCFKYVSDNNNSWGTNGRWKSHIREALTATKDHCLLLNQAIRKYGVDNFDVTTICDCDEDDIDDKEIYYINVKRDW